MSQTTQLERESLEAHVDLCAIRYENLDKRLSNVETKLDKLSEAIDSGHQNMSKVIIGAAGTIVASCLSIVVVMLMQ